MYVGEDRRQATHCSLLHVCSTNYSGRYLWGPQNSTQACHCIETMELHAAKWQVNAADGVESWLSEKTREQRAAKQQARFFISQSHTWGMLSYIPTFHTWACALSCFTFAAMFSTPKGDKCQPYAPIHPHSDTYYGGVLVNVSKYKISGPKDWLLVYYM